MRQNQRAHGPATILAIGTTNPKDYIYQADYPDHYFRVTNSEHMTELKQKFTRICDKSMIKKRHLILTEEFLKENASSGISSYDATSLNFRQDIIMEHIPKMGAEAALKAIEEWGQPKLKITHIVFCTRVPAEMPGADYQLIKLLGLNPTVKRVLLYHQGCFAGGSVLRIAKDLAENNADARVLVVCSESTVVMFRGPSEESIASLIGQAIFGDGASSVIIGSDPKEVEQPIFEIMFTAETILPDSDNAIGAQLRDCGVTIHLSEKVPYLIANNIEKSLVEAFEPFGIDDWNSIFWAPHPGGPKILDKIEAELGLKKDKFKATRNVLGEYGNMSSASMLFILDEIKRKSKEEKMATTGEGLEWGVLFGFGPGITVETVVLRSIATA